MAGVSLYRDLVGYWGELVSFILVAFYFDDRTLINASLIGTAGSVHWCMGWKGLGEHREERGEGQRAEKGDERKEKSQDGKGDERSEKGGG